MRPPRPSEGERRGPGTAFPVAGRGFSTTRRGFNLSLWILRGIMRQVFCGLEVENLLHLTDKEIRGMRMTFVDGSRGRLRTRRTDALLPLTAARGEPPGSRDGSSERPPSLQRPRLSHRLQPLGAEAVTSNDEKNKTK